MKNIRLVIIVLLIIISCRPSSNNNHPSIMHGRLKISKENRYIEHEDGTPFLWIGCTAWGMTEWLNREDVDLYLDDRKAKGMNVVQLCLFWGKRVDYPTKFTANAPNPYGHKAFLEVDGFPDASQPAIIEGGSPEEPNDYWDHVDYCLGAIKKRGMYAAVLPFWGRRYVNATHKNQSLKVFTKDNIFIYGEFLGKRYGNEPNIIWVNGGDVKADHGGNFLPEYRLLAEGLIKGITSKNVAWNEKSELWDAALMTYHPDGSPMINSSARFHNDPWLDFNMIETYIWHDSIAASVRQDFNIIPVKPTVLGEGHYEGYTNRHLAQAINIRRQAHQTFFAGAAGFTYGGGFDEEGNGPLFSPSNNWKPLLEWEGAGQLIHLRGFLEKNNWWEWETVPEMILEGRGKGELEKLVVRRGKSIYVYFPDNSACKLKIEEPRKVSWYNPKNGKIVDEVLNQNISYTPPENFEDAVLILN